MFPHMPQRAIHIAHRRPTRRVVNKHEWRSRRAKIINNRNYGSGMFNYNTGRGSLKVNDGSGTYNDVAGSMYNQTTIHFNSIQPYRGCNNCKRRGRKHYYRPEKQQDIVMSSRVASITAREKLAFCLTILAIVVAFHAHQPYNPKTSVQGRGVAYTKLLYCDNGPAYYVVIHHWQNG